LLNFFSAFTNNYGSFTGKNCERFFIVIKQKKEYKKKNIKKTIMSVKLNGKTYFVEKKKEKGLLTIQVKLTRKKKKIKNIS